MKKKRILTEEQKAYQKIYQAEWRANRSVEKVAEDKAKAKINKAKWHLENKEEQKRQMQEWHKANPNYSKEQGKRFHKENPGYYKAYSKKWQEANPGYVSPCAVDLGFWIVYIITDYNGLGNDYCGMTQNIYKRINKHKSLGKLNTDTYTIVKKCDTLEDALELESAVHNFGYHGDARTESGK